MFSKPIYAPDKHGLSFNRVLETLLAMANYRPMPETSIIHFVRYPADTLYILAENQDFIVSQLMDFGKKWRADVVDVCDSSNDNSQEEWGSSDYVSIRLQGALWGEDFKQDRDAVIVSYWWD